MRRISLWALSTLTTLVLLFSYHTSTSSTAAPTAAAVVAHASAANQGSSSTSTPTPSTTTPSTTTPSTTSSSSSSGTKTYDGTAVSTQYGDVQVQITVTNGKITAAQVLQVPWNDHRDQEINSYAVPVLNSEVVSAQSADIDMVSGATFTSDGYIQSLQSAIDQAHL